MTTKLESFLQSIDPARNMEEVSRRVDQALNSYRMGKGIIHNWDEFKLLVSKFCSHIESVVLRMPHAIFFNPDISWGRCCRIFIKEYGHNGEKTAFELARTGAEGGVFSVLKVVAKRMGEEYARQEISARISHFYGGLTVGEKLAVCEEYLEKYGQLLPPELTEGSAVRVKANFTKVLEDHPNLIMRLRDIGRGR